MLTIKPLNLFGGWFTNDRVCEGCGDCSAKSNCMSVVPVETEYGRKRWIDQSSCNKDFSCVNGFCPSFVTVHGGKLRKGKGLAGADQDFGDLPEPVLPSLAEPYGILVTGVGGTGVVTIGVLLGMAANIENKGVSVLDMAGLAQKGGPVWSHIRIAARPEQLYATRIATGEANAVIDCDIVVAMADESIAQALARAGANVMLNGFGDAHEIDKLRAGIATQYGVGALYSGADMTQPDQITDMVRQAAAEFGSVDILVNNAGIQLVSPVDDLPGEKWEAILAINLSSNFYTIRAALPGMKRRNWGASSTSPRPTA